MRPLRNLGERGLTFVAVLLALLAALVVWARASDADVAGTVASSALLSAAAWVAFAAPWVLLIGAVRTTLRWLGRARSTAEILAR